MDKNNNYTKLLQDCKNPKSANFSRFFNKRKSVILKKLFYLFRQYSINVV